MQISVASEPVEAGETTPADLLIDRAIAAIDARIGAQLDAILHHPRLRRLEGMWRGLHWLVRTAEPAAKLKIKLLVVSWFEIGRDLERAAEFDQSHLFRRVYEDEFGTPGGEPYGLLAIDHEVRHAPGPGAPADDPAIVADLAAVAAAAFSPIVLAAAPALFDANDWPDLALAHDPASALRNPAHARWRRLGGREDMRFLAVALPRVLARVPWPDDPARADGFRYAEQARSSTDRVWMSAVYPFAATVLRAYARFGWPADVRGVDTDREGGGVVTHLPAEPLSTERVPVWPRAALDLTFNDRQERSVVEAGLMPLAALPFTGDAAFVALRSLQVAAAYDREAATANARLSAQFNAILCVSRFAHYVKVIGRDTVGALRTQEEVQRRLQDWLRRYVNSNTIAGAESRARAPLLAGEVQVRERIGSPGVFDCTIFLQPHFQLDDVSATFRLTTELAAPGRRR